MLLTIISVVIALLLGGACGYLLFLIIATGQREKYSKEYAECVRQCRKLMPSVLRHAELSPRQKLSTCAHGLFPVQMAKRDLRKETAARAKDHML